MYEYVHVCISIYIYTYVCVAIYIYTCMCVYFYLHIHMHRYILVCIYRYIHVYNIESIGFKGHLTLLDICVLFLSFFILKGWCDR